MNQQASNNLDRLNSLIARKNELLKQKHIITRSKAKTNLSGSLSTSSDIIEDSDTDLSKPKFSSTKIFRENVTIVGTDDEFENDDINTSTICLPRTHSFFHSSNETSSAAQSTMSTPAQTKPTQITILSDVVIRAPDCETFKPYVDPVNLSENINMQLENEECNASQNANKFDALQNFTTNNNSQRKDGTDNHDEFIEKEITETRIVQDNVSSCIAQIDEPSTSKFCEFTTNIHFIESQHETNSESVLSQGISSIEYNTRIEPEVFNYKSVTNEGQCQYASAGDDENLNSDIQPITTNPERESPSAKSNKLRLTTQFRKTYIDFMLEDDLDDFSCGSSDLWTPKDSEIESSPENKNTIKRKTKKRDNSRKKNIDKIVLPIQKQKPVNKNKIRKALRETGSSYETRLGKPKSAREMKENPCKEGKCPRKCYEITEERRQSIFDFFWNLDSQRKKEWIVHCVNHISIKRKRTDSENSRRSKTLEYYINEGEGRRQVCQQFIMNTLSISQTYLLYNISHAEEGISRDEQRSRHAKNKYDESTYTFAKEYIEKLPVLPSHYSRKNSSKLYLPQEFKNISNLYRIYAKFCQEQSQEYLSERLFRNLFTQEYNISFHIPKKDKCKFCVKFENNTNVLNEQETIAFMQHKEEKKACYRRCEIHRNILYKANLIVIASFDLQKVLNTPHGESMLLYYSRKYAVYNLTVYESNTQNGYCYTWGEADGKRGSAEIGTCLYNYLIEVDKKGAKYVILYCDSCGGQNKNRVILSIFKYFLEKSLNVQVIQVNYLLPGHTYMAVDSMHSVIEREVRKLIVWSPKQWATFMLTARKVPRPYEVKTLDHTDFIDWQIITGKIFTAKTVSNKDLKLRDIRIATFKKTNLEVMEVKYTMKENGDSYEIPLGQDAKRKVTEVRVKGKGWGKGRSNERTINENLDASTELPRLYTSRLPISTKKYRDLKKLCEDGVIPKQYAQDYLSLPYVDKIDTLDIGNNDDDESDKDVEEEMINSGNDEPNIPDISVGGTQPSKRQTTGKEETQQKRSKSEKVDTGKSLTRKGKGVKQETDPGKIIQKIMLKEKAQGKTKQGKPSASKTGRKKNK